MRPDNTKDIRKKLEGYFGVESPNDVAPEFVLATQAGLGSEDSIDGAPEFTRSLEDIDDSEIVISAPLEKLEVFNGLGSYLSSLTNIEVYRMSVPHEATVMSADALRRVFWQLAQSLRGSDEYYSWAWLDYGVTEAIPREELVQMANSKEYLQKMITKDLGYSLEDAIEISPETVDKYHQKAVYFLQKLEAAEKVE